jgi:dolichol-phosphate mannosyltransferase
MYEGAAETWREWGRSLDLKDAATIAQVWGDIWLLLMVQGLPLLVTLALLPGALTQSLNLVMLTLFWLNLGLVLIRFGLNFAIAPSYDLTQAKPVFLFWLSPLTDPLAVLRIILSSTKKPKKWRGRTY